MKNKYTGQIYLLATPLHPSGSLGGRDCCIIHRIVSHQCGSVRAGRCRRSSCRLATGIITLFRCYRDAVCGASRDFRLDCRDPRARALLDSLADDFPACFCDPFAAGRAAIATLDNSRNLLGRRYCRKVCQVLGDDRARFLVRKTICSRCLCCSPHEPGATR